MQIKLIKYPSDEDWIIVKNDALGTLRKETEDVPTSEWMTKILVSEHSPIRDLIYHWEWIDLPYWVSVHFVRHKIGIEHFVSSQRNDLQHDYDRTKAPQDAPVNHKCSANAQTIINASKVRLCGRASLETRQAWRMFVDAIKDVTPGLYELCVPTCVYRNGLCPEFKCCGYNRTLKFRQELESYRKKFNYCEGGS